MVSKVTKFFSLSGLLLGSPMSPPSSHRIIELDMSPSLLISLAIRDHSTRLDKLINTFLMFIMCVIVLEQIELKNWRCEL